MPHNLDALAGALLAAYDHTTLVERPSQAEPLSIAEAYAVLARLTERRRARGERTVGRKIGFTNRALWPEYGVDRPLWAHVYAGTLHDAAGGRATLSLAHMVAPRIEPEIVLGLREPPAPDADEAALARAVAWVAPGFEVVDCHYPGWQFTSAECAADFGLHAALVVGRRVAAEGDPALLAEQLRTCRLALSCDGRRVAEGVGANALGSPLLALRHLAAVLAEQGSEPLRAGEVVTTGTLTAAMPIAAGQRWGWSAAGLGVGELELETAGGAAQEAR